MKLKELGRNLKISPKIVMLSYLVIAFMLFTNNAFAASESLDSEKVKEPLLVLREIFNDEADYAGKVIDTKYFYDDTGSIEKEVIKFVEELNENELKDNHYFVHVTDSMDEDMEKYKLSLFNDMLYQGRSDSPELDNAILFVLNTDTGEYGIQTGDEVIDKTKNKLDGDYVSDVANKQLKSKEWNNAVIKVSQYLPEIVNTSSEKESSEKEEQGYSSIKRKLLPLFFMLPFIVFGICYWRLNIDVELKKFMKSEEFYKYMITNNLIKADFKKEFLRYYSNDPNTLGLWRHTIDKIASNIDEKTSDSVTTAEIKNLLPYEDYKRSYNNRSIEVNTLIIFQDHFGYSK